MVRTAGKRIKLHVPTEYYAFGEATVIKILELKPERTLAFLKKKKGSSIAAPLVQFLLDLELVLQPETDYTCTSYGGVSV
jgi:hypothetical protein